MKVIGSEPLDEPHPSEPGYHLVSDGTPQGTHLLLNGKSLPGITRIDWEAESLSPTHAIVTVQVVRADIIGVEPRWFGLEDVPTDALRAELENRE